MIRFWQAMAAGVLLLTTTGLQAGGPWNASALELYTGWTPQAFYVEGQSPESRLRLKDGSERGIGYTAVFSERAELTLMLLDQREDGRNAMLRAAYDALGLFVTGKWRGERWLGAVVPWVGGGAHYSRGDLTWRAVAAEAAVPASRRETVWGLQAEAGVDFYLGPLDALALTLGLQYRLPLSDGGAMENDGRTAVFAGLRWDFGMRPQ